MLETQRRRGFWLWELSCTYAEIFNEEKPPLAKHFLESFDSCVAYVVDYSCVFVEHWGCCKNVLYTVDYSHV
jgi:hypothetical protein